MEEVGLGPLQVLMTMLVEKWEEGTPSDGNKR